MTATDTETTTLQLPARDFGGYIFDCDGTLVDSMPLHYVCWVEALRNNGATYEFTEEEFYYYAGVPEKDTVIILNAKHNVFIDPEAVVTTKAAQFLKHIGDLKVVRPVADYARSLYGTRPISVASGSEAPVVRACLT